MKKLTPQHYRSMPWKNGAGVTIEIAVFPENAQLDDFLWRVSRAKVVQEGEFSHFSGIDRSLALLQGKGMRLRVNGVSQQLDTRQNILSFAGDVVTYAELMDGAISDLNLMSRRACCWHQLTRWSGAESYELPLETVLLYCAQGSGQIAGLTLHRDESLCFEMSEARGYFLDSSSDSIFYCVQIRMSHGK